MARTTPSSTTAMSASQLRHQRRAHRQARVGRARHRDRDARDAQLCRPPAQPWLGHLMVSRSGDRAAAADAGRGDAAAADDEIVMVAGIAADPGEEGALLRGCPLHGARAAAAGACERPDSGKGRTIGAPFRLPPRPQLEMQPTTAGRSSDDDDTTGSERRLQPELSRVKPVEKEGADRQRIRPRWSRDDAEDEAARERSGMNRQMQGIARQVSLDPNDGMEL
jgi:type IV secretion system protein VirD4